MNPFPPAPLGGPDLTHRPQRRFFFEYDPATGYFTGNHWVITGATPDVPLPASELAIYEGQVDPDTQFIDPATGTLTALSAAEVAAYHQGPPDNWKQWDIATRTWIDVRSPAMILNQIQAARVAAIKAEALARMGNVFAPLSDPSMLAVFRELYLSIAPAARQPTAAMSAAINIYQAAAQAITSVNAATSQDQVAAVVVGWP